jgi:uncharacterized protein involved in type VI secretion and phage assembly
VIAFEDMQKFLVSSEQPKRLFGVVVAVVTNNEDPDKLGRVKVKFPWLSDEDESHWARVLTPMAGKDRGVYFLPEVEDEVLVAFEHGLVHAPYVIGALWNGQDAPPATNDDGGNNIRVIKSRSGHVIRLDDTEGEEKIEIIDKSEANSIVIDTKDNAISIKTEGNITLESSQGDIIIKGQNVEVEATGQDIKTKAAANINAEAGAQCNISGSKINLN